MGLAEQPSPGRQTEDTAPGVSSTPNVCRPQREQAVMWGNIPASLRSARMQPPLCLLHTEQLVYNTSITPAYPDHRPKTTPSPLPGGTPPAPQPSRPPRPPLPSFSRGLPRARNSSRGTSPRGPQPRAAGPPEVFRPLADGKPRAGAGGRGEGRGEGESTPGKAPLPRPPRPGRGRGADPAPAGLPAKHTGRYPGPCRCRLRHFLPGWPGTEPPAGTAVIVWRPDPR